MDIKLKAADRCPLTGETLTAADIQEASHRHDYNVRSLNIIASIIGFPSKRKAQIALKRVNEIGDKKSKKKYEIEKEKYTAHKLLLDLLEEDIMNAYDSVSKNAPNPEELANPSLILGGWRQVWADNGQSLITPISLQKSGTKTIRSLAGLTSRIIKKRDLLKTKKGNKIPKYVIALAPPQLVASWADSYGILNPIIERVLRQSDTNVQQTAKYHRKLSKTIGEMADFFNAITVPTDSNPNAQLNLNNGLMSYSYTNYDTGETEVSGLKGVRIAKKGKKWHNLKDYGIGDRVIITGSVPRNGELGYNFVKEDNPAGEPKWLPATSFDKDTEEIASLLSDKYSNELMYELGSGQTRYIVPRVLDLTTDETGKFLLNNEIGADLKRIKIKLTEMAASAALAEETGVGNRVPGVHTKIHKDDKGRVWEYRYMMIKQGEEGKATSGERYNLYLLDKAETQAGKRVKNGEQINFIGENLTVIDGKATKEKTSYDATELKNVMGGEGFFRSMGYNDFGKHVTKDNKPIYGSHKKQFTSFERMGQQPNEIAMEGVWKLLSEHRSVYKEAWLETSVRARKTNINRAMWDKTVRADLKRNGKSRVDNEVITEQELDDEIEAYFDELYNMGGIEHNLNRDEETGELRMPQMYAMPKKENYMPSLYSKESIVHSQLPRQITRLKNKIIEFQKAGDEEKIKQYEEGLVHLQSLINQHTGDDKPDHNIHDLSRIPGLKHITAWTNPLDVRKDGEVLTDYLNNMYSSLNRNDTTIEMLQALHHGNQIQDAKGDGLVHGAMNYMVNRVKIAYGDTSSKGMTILGNPRSYDGLGEKLNALPHDLTGGVKWDGKSAERLTKWITAPMTLYHLGGSAAVVNNTQFVNRFIRVGFKGLNRARKLLKGKLTRDDWEKYVANTGVLNILSVFEDIMLTNGDPKYNHAGLFNIAGVPIPTRNLVHFGRLLLKGRQSFIDGGKGFEETDTFLAMIEARNKGKSQQNIQNLRNANELLESIGDKKLREKRAQYYDVWTLGEDQAEKVIKQSFKNLVGEVSDQQLKKMVTWKLGWWFNELGGPGDDIFTFTKTEETLRSYTAVSAIMDAFDKGLLGDGKPEEMFMSDAAVKVARNAVYAEQFGMTPPHMGELFNGFGRAVWQYKQYPTNQVIHDYRIWKAFTDGSYDMTDSINRLTSAMIESVNPNSTAEVDQEAIQMARFLFTRATATVLGSLASTVPYIGYMLRNAGGGGGKWDISSLIRGAENPILATTFRIMTYAVIAGMGGEEDDEDLLIPFVGVPLSFLLIPVLIGTMARWSIGAISSLGED